MVYMVLRYLCPLISALMMLWPTRAGAETRFGLATDLGLGGIGSKAYTTLQSSVELEAKGLEVELFGRVRILVEGDDDDGRVRRRDWDEASDYVHILRRLDFRRRIGPADLHMNVGEITGFTLGHGTLVRDYASIADPDHLHSGFRLEVAASRLAFAGIVDNLVYPRVIAARLAARPVGRAPGLSVGASVVFDPSAPERVLLGAAGERLVDDTSRLVTKDRVLGLAGLDIEYTLGLGERGKLVPYLDVNTSFQGVGLHVGFTGAVALARNLRVAAQLEYRVSSAGYSPSYVETFYDVERYQAGLTFDRPASASAAAQGTKLAALDQGLFGGQGGLAQLGLDIARVCRLKLGFTHRPGPDENSLYFRAATNPFPRLQLGAMLLVRGLGGEGDVASGLVAYAEGRVQITERFYALAQYSRTYALREDTRTFGALQALNLSLGFDWER
jgi:hypothetical protein